MERPRPLILLGVRHWSQGLPVWRLLRQLGQDRPKGESLYLLDTIDEVMTVLSGPGRDP